MWPQVRNLMRKKNDWPLWSAYHLWTQTTSTATWVELNYLTAPLWLADYTSHIMLRTEKVGKFRTTMTDIFQICMSSQDILLRTQHVRPLIVPKEKNTAHTVLYLCSICALKLTLLSSLEGVEWKAGTTCNREGFILPHKSLPSWLTTSSHWLEYTSLSPWPHLTSPSYWLLVWGGTRLSLPEWEM